MFCVHCGSEIDESSEYCPYCGGAQDVVRVMESPDGELPFSYTGASSINPAHARIDTDYDRGFKMRPFLFGAGFAVALLLSLFVGKLVLGVLNTFESGFDDQQEQVTAPATGGESGTLAATEPPEAEAEAEPEAEAVEETEPEVDAAGNAVPTSGPVFSSATSSSDLPGDYVTSYYGPYNATDGIKTTAWVEGGEGDGIGEWFQISSFTPQSIRGIDVMNGYPKSWDTFYANNRIQDVTITLSDGYELHTTLADTYGEWQAIEFDGLHETTYVRLTIDSVYSGNTYYDTCLCDVDVH